MSEERKRTERDNLELRRGQIRHLPVAGAVPLEEVEQMVRAAGLADVRFIPRTDYVGALEQFEDPLYRKVAEHQPSGNGMTDCLVSQRITARKSAPAE